MPSPVPPARAAHRGAAVAWRTETAGHWAAHALGHVTSGHLRARPPRCSLELTRGW